MNLTPYTPDGVDDDRAELPLRGRLWKYLRDVGRWHRNNFLYALDGQGEFRPVPPTPRRLTANYWTD